MCPSEIQKPKRDSYLDQTEDECGRFFYSIKKQYRNSTKTQIERGGSVVTHETRMREVPGANPVAGQPG